MEYSTSSPSRLVAFSLTSVGLACGAVAAPTQQPNILFIMSDDHANKAMTAYSDFFAGHNLSTPSLDRIAEEGMRFDNAFSICSICGPSRATILTGKYTHEHEYWSNRGEAWSYYDASAQNFVPLIRDAGYQTALIGKWHLYGDEPEMFDYYSFHCERWLQGAYYEPDYNTNGVQAEDSGYATTNTTDKSLAWLDARDTSKPFLLMCHFKATHASFTPDTQFHPEDRELFQKNNGEPLEFPLPPIFWTNHDGKCSVGERDIAGLRGGATNGVPEGYLEGVSDSVLKIRNYRTLMMNYLATVLSIDRSVHRLLSYLDSTGLADNTIVFYTSDQGYLLGEHGYMDKRWMYEPSLRQPLVVRYPGVIQAGSSSDAFVLNLDFPETFLDYAGVSIPSWMQGRSIRPVLEGQTPADWRTAMYYHYYEYFADKDDALPNHYGIRTQRYKLFHTYDPVDCWELYDLQTDPLEEHNLYNDASQAQRIDSLKEQLRILQKRYGNCTIDGDSWTDCSLVDTLEQDTADSTAVGQPAYFMEQGTLRISHSRNTIHVQSDYPATLSLYSVRGRRTYRTDIDRGGSILLNPSRRLSPGVYVACLTSSEKSVRTKLSLVR